MRLGIEIGLSQDAIIDAVDYFENPSVSAESGGGGGEVRASSASGASGSIREEPSVGSSLGEGKSSSSAGRGSSLEMMLSQVGRGM